MPPRKTYPPASRRSARLTPNLAQQVVGPPDPFAITIKEDSDEESDPDQDPDPDTNPDHEVPADLISAQLQQLPLDSAMAESSALSQILAQMQAMQAEITQLRASQSPAVSRQGSPMDIAFGGNIFMATGIAAHPAFRPFSGANGANIQYDRKEKPRARDPEKFEGSRDSFDNWAYKVAGKLEEDVATFRTEKSRILYLMTLLAGPAEKTVETRFQSATRPFSCVAELIQVLAAAYHDPNQASVARTTLAKLHYTPGKIEISAFIAEFNALAMKAEIPEQGWKGNLWDHIPADLDPRLLHDSVDPSVSYESFCELVTRAAFSKQKAFQDRQGNRLPLTATQTRRPVMSTQTKTTTTASSSAKTGPRLSEAEKLAHWAADTCFRCGQTGHKIADCPQKRQKQVATVDIDDDQGKDLD